MSEELDVLQEVTQRLAGAHISYMVTGSIAVSYYAVPRMTRDIDLVVELSSGDADRFCDLFLTGLTAPHVGDEGPEAPR